MNNPIPLIKALAKPDPAAIESAVTDWLDDHPEATTTVQDGSITKAKLNSDLQGAVDEVGVLKSAFNALLTALEHVAWTDENGQAYCDAIYDALHPSATLTGISAVYTQSGTVYSTDTLDSLKADLVVTASYDDGTTETVSNYTLSGSLTAGTSIITATYSGQTDTFSVTVTASSGMDGWTDGVAYRNLEIVQNEYCRASDGTFISYNGWDRTGYVPCDGAGSITFPPYTGASSVSDCGSNRFYDQNHDVIGTQIMLSLTETKTIAVPSGAYYFVLSSISAPLAACINAGIIPNEAGV